MGRSRTKFASLTSSARPLLAALTCVFITYYSCVKGLAAREAYPTDGVSEQQTLADAKRVHEGNHRYGIAAYTHYPNGPSYMLLPSLALGTETTRDLRAVPVVFAAICFGIFSLGLVLHLSSVLFYPLSLLALYCLISQPGVVYWMGALHQQAYGLGLCFAGMGLALISATPNFAFALLGFIAGWMGYDMIPCFVFSLFTCRLLTYAREPLSSRRALISSTRDSLFLCAGVLFAVLTHLIQNALFFGSLSAAFKDLAGSAGARAGTELLATMNQGYWNNIQFAMRADPTLTDLSRLELIKAHVEHFLMPQWTDLSSAGHSFSAVGIALIVAFAATSTIRRPSRPSLERFVCLCALMIAGVLLSATAWIMIMPNHARFHFHFLPRHFFVPAVTIWIMLYSWTDMAAARLFRTNRDSASHDQR